LGALALDIGQSLEPIPPAGITAKNLCIAALLESIAFSP